MNSRREKLTGVNESGGSQLTSSSDEPRRAADEITCQEFVELVTDYFEGVLSPRSLNLVEEHLVMCDWCVTYADQIRATVASLGELRSEPAPGEPSAAVLAALQKRRERSE